MTSHTTPADKPNVDRSLENHVGFRFSIIVGKTFCPKKLTKLIENNNNMLQIFYAPPRYTLAVCIGAQKQKRSGEHEKLYSESAFDFHAELLCF